MHAFPGRNFAVNIRVIDVKDTTGICFIIMDE